MTKKDCSIARDLMPLVLDSVASAESKDFVERHIDACDECRAYYQGLSAKIAPVAEPDSNFINFCRKMERRFSWRGIVKWMAILLIPVLILIFAGWATYHNVFTDQVEMPSSWVDLTLTADENGWITETYQMLDGHRYYYKGTSGYTDAHGICYVSPLKPVWQIDFLYGDGTDVLHRTSNFRILDGALKYVYDINSRSVYDPSINAYVDDCEPVYKTVQEIRLGSENDYKVIWKKGDPLPPAVKL